MWGWLKPIAEDDAPAGVEALRAQLSAARDAAQQARLDWNLASADWESRLEKPKNPYRIRRNPVQRLFVVEQWKAIPPYQPSVNMMQMMNKHFWYKYGEKVGIEHEIADCDAEKRTYEDLLTEGSIEWQPMRDGFPYEADAVQWLRQYLNADEISEYDRDAKRQTPVVA